MRLKENWIKKKERDRQEDEEINSVGVSNNVGVFAGKVK